jgi:hypothetical protein
VVHSGVPAKCADWVFDGEKQGVREERLVLKKKIYNFPFFLKFICKMPIYCFKTEDCDFIFVTCSSRV